MIWIEFLGPSGVGKSYWCQKFIEKYPDYEINTLTLKRIRKSIHYSKSPLYIKFYFFLFYLNVPKLKTFTKQSLIIYFLRNFEKKDKSIYTINDENIIRKYLEAILKVEEPHILKLKRIEYFANQLRRQKFYNFYLEDNDVFISEDGLQHLAPIFISELKPNLYIILNKDLSNITEQRLKRAKSNPTTFIEFLLDTNDLKKYLEVYYLIYQKKINDIKQIELKRNTLELDCDKQDIIQLIYERIQLLQNNGK